MRTPATGSPAVVTTRPRITWSPTGSGRGAVFASSTTRSRNSSCDAGSGTCCAVTPEATRPSIRDTIHEVGGRWTRSMGRAPHRQTSSRGKHNGGRRALMVMVSLLVAGFAAPRAQAEGSDPATLLVGRVLGERRVPVAGANVVLRQDDPPVARAAKTDGEGRFEIVAPLAPYDPSPLQGTLFVTTDDRRAGFAPVWGGEERRAGRQILAQVEPIVLETCGRLQVEVRDSDGPVADAAVELRLPHGSAAVATAAS